MTAAAPWHPDIRRDLVPGVPSRFWGQAWRGAVVAAGLRRERAERAAGYTTRVGHEHADEALVDVDVVDPRSGRVLRLAGEPMPRAFCNDRAAFMRDRLARVRAAASA